MNGAVAPDLMVSKSSFIIIIIIIVLNDVQCSESSDGAWSWHRGTQHDYRGTRPSRLSDARLEYPDYQRDKSSGQHCQDNNVALHRNAIEVFLTTLSDVSLRDLEDVGKAGGLVGQPLVTKWSVITRKRRLTPPSYDLQKRAKCNIISLVSLLTF